MLRVTALAKIIIDNWSGDSLNEVVIIQACLFHDTAKIIKFKHFDEDKKHWKKVQQEMIKKYGENDHKATIEICREVGISEKAIRILENKNLRPYINRVRNIAKSDDYNLKILQYCDSRTAPNGLVSLDERYKELMQRDSSKKMDAEAKESMGLCYEIEKQVQNNTNMQLHKISNEEVESKASELERYEI